MRLAVFYRDCLPFLELTGSLGDGRFSFALGDRESASKRRASPERRGNRDDPSAKEKGLALDEFQSQSLVEMLLSLICVLS